MKKLATFLMIFCAILMGSQMIQAQENTDLDETKFNAQANQMTAQFTQKFKLTETQQKTVFNLVKAALYKIYAAEAELTIAENSAEAQKNYRQTMGKIKSKMMHDVQQILTEDQRKILEQQTNRRR